MSSCEARYAVKHREGVTHPTIGFLCDESQGRLLGIDAFALGDIAQMARDVLHRDTLEVVNLTAREDGGENLVLLSRRQDEDGVGRWLFEGLEEGIEGRCREHMHLVNDIDLVATKGGRHLHLLGELTDVLDRVVGRSIQLEDVEGALLFEGTTALAHATRFPLSREVLAVDGTCQDTRRCRLPHPTWPTEEVGVGELPREDSGAECGSHSFLTDDTTEGIGAIFACGDDVVLCHSSISVRVLLVGQRYVFPSSL